MCNAPKDLVIFVSLHLLFYNKKNCVNYFVDLTRKGLHYGKSFERCIYLGQFDGLDMTLLSWDNSIVLRRPYCLEMTLLSWDDPIILRWPCEVGRILKSVMLTNSSYLSIIPFEVRLLARTEQKWFVQYVWVCVMQLCPVCISVALQFVILLIWVYCLLSFLKTIHRLSFSHVAAFPFDLPILMHTYIHIYIL